MITLFLFRRDLRIEDNRGLLHALRESSSVIPGFVFTPDQVGKNPYKSGPCLQFMIESLEDLDGQLEMKGGKLFFFYGAPEKIVEKCIEELGVGRVVVNRDYTPYSKRRDEKISAVCKKHRVAFESIDDALLHPPEKVLKKDGKPYSVFTPYHKNASRLAVDRPQKAISGTFWKREISFAKGPELLRKILPKRNPNLALRGGRGEALKILKRIAGLKEYKKMRDFPAADATSHLSAHLKFTTVSPREVFYRIKESLGSRHELIRSLYWRDFFTHIGFFFPHVFEGAYHKKFDRLKWSYDKGAFRRWCEGKTGFPIVDAGMRELNETGWMHNRVRMIVASFLIKDLHIDWRWGEKYFATHLIDYDPAVNNGNWQWCASTGCDAQPYFRIFNPWSQQEKFDPDCVYIKRWVTELKNFPPSEIHRGEAAAPMLDHADEAKRALQMYRSL
jgi:deoxyribodipyrimidine photo-lyase